MVLLINPKTTKNSQEKEFYFREPNLGILYLAAILDDQNYNVELLDLEQYLYSEDFNIERVIKSHIKYHKIFGITSLTNTYSKAIEITKVIKSFNDEFITILGGPHVSFLYDKILTNDLENQKIIDFICVGESEKCFVSIVKLLKERKYSIENLSKFESKLNKIKGLAYINSKRKLKFTGFEYDPINIELLPLPARNLLTNVKYYYNVANVIVNRGCPNQCSFCSRQNLFKKTRVRSLDSIFSEINDIDSLQTYKYLNFYDNINLNKAFFREFCKYYMKLNQSYEKPFPWGCELRVDTIDAKDAKLLKKSGCELIATGIESASKKVLKKNFKYQEPTLVKQGIANLKKENLSIQAYFVLGLPGETIETFNKTIEFIKDLPLNKEDKINYFIATPYPGSRLWTEKENFGIDIFEKDFDKYDCEHLIFKTNDLNETQLTELVEKAKEIENYFAL